MPGSEQYAYAVGRIRAMENGMFGRTLVERLIDAETPAMCLPILVDAGYPPFEGSGVPAVRAYVKSLEQYEANVIADLKTFVPEPELFDIFSLKNDYFNAKIIIKSIRDPESTYELSENGTMSAKDIKHAFMEGKYELLPGSLKQVASEAIDELAKTGKSQYAELILDKAYFEDCYALTKKAARRQTRKFLNAFIEMQADLSNISTMLRIKQRAGKDADAALMNRAYVKGALKAEFFENALAEDMQKVRDLFIKTPYYKILSDGLERYEVTGSLSHFEKLCDDYIMEYLTEVGKNPLGIEALFAYTVGRMREIANIRLVLIGKLNNLQTIAIRERLRELRVKK